MIFQASISSIFQEFEFWRSRMIEILKCNKLPINWRFPSINLSNCCLLLKIANAAVTYFEDQLYHQRIVKHSSFFIVLWFLNKSEVWKFVKSLIFKIESGVFEFSRKLNEIGKIFETKIPKKKMSWMSKLTIEIKELWMFIHLFDLCDLPQFQLLFTELRVKIQM